MTTSVLSKKNLECLTTGAFAALYVVSLGLSVYLRVSL